MMSRTFGFVLLTLAVTVGVADVHATTPAPCFKAQCCHATSCTTTQPDCSAAICTRDCAPGTMDCGAGWCSYTADGQCTAFWANATSPAPTTSTTCSGGSTDNLACVPAQCCHPT